ncbi:MAG TPA: alanine--tRNA ligase [Leptospiraceae bacterium]|nr:alanine--tRNA ligase [Leptospiraceae bacterium]
MYKTVAEIRKLFIDYFRNNGHTIVASSSLIPVGDPTLLFTTAGMVQFKPYFTGAVELTFTRAATSQKSLRTTDLENVGRTERHCTFFEMLGNFSFGDYFKKDAIAYALDFSTKHLGFDKEKIWITVYLDDDEAENFWLAEGIPKERIVRLGKKDNFWGPAGDTGACGPCSELYLDRGPEKGGPNCGTSNTCKPGCDCDRFLEFWNLVFNQFDQDINGKLNPLKQTGIDTGSGLERVALLLQNVDSVYDTDELRRIIGFIEKLSGKAYDTETKMAFRVLTDHSRAITFSISDGVMPDKTGRGYVIRRLIRRASLFARRIGIKEAFIYKVIPEIVDIYKEEYPDLAKRQTEIIRIVKSEEDLFLNTLELGLAVIDSMTKQYEAKKEKRFSGADTFKLYGTYGFPAEMTKEILRDRGFEFDEKGFAEELEKDRKLSRDSWKGKKAQILSSLGEKIPATKFTGYEKVSDEGKILFILQDSKPVSALKTGEDGIIVLNQSCFYGESGGQIGDSGYIKLGENLFQVKDTQKENDVILHIGSLLKGELKVGDFISTEVESNRRELLTYHHSGTHLLNGALRELLGTHVAQKASLVSDEYLRFDFSHNAALSEDEIIQIESKVNEAIQSSVDVATQVLSIEEAKKTGAVAFFEEKYGDIVRVIQMGKYSVEFCGGTHVRNTGNIKYFYIQKESSPGAGNRRIEAVCGSPVIEFFQKEFQALSQKTQEFNLKAKDVFKDSKNFIDSKIPSPDEVQDAFLKQGAVTVKQYRDLKRNIEKELIEKNTVLTKEKKRLESEGNNSILSQADSIFASAEKIGSTHFINHSFQDLKIDVLKELGDRIKNRSEKVFISFVLESEANKAVLLMANKIAVESGLDCNQILKSSMSILNGKGGGKVDMAQGSTSKETSTPEIIETVKKEIIKRVN